MLKVDRDWQAIGNAQDVLGRFMFMQYARYVWDNNRIVARVVSALRFQLQKPVPGGWAVVSTHDSMEDCWNCFQIVYPELWNADAEAFIPGPKHADPAPAL